MTVYQQKNLKWVLLGFAALLFCIILPGVPVAASSNTVTSITGTLPLMISNVQSSAITRKTAMISWNTNGKSTSQIFYDTVSHDSVDNYIYHNILNKALLIQHHSILNSLSPSTTYHYRIQSTSVIDGIDFIAVSDDFTFKTSSGGGGSGINYIPSTPASSLTPIPTPTPSPTPTASGETTPTPTPTPAPTPEYLSVNFLGKVTKGQITGDGALINDLVAISPDGSSSIELPKGTIVTGGSGKIVRQITVTGTQMPPLPQDEVALGQALDFQPSPAGFSRQITITLGYDASQVPQNIQSISLAYYTADSGWQNVTAAGGAIAGAGQASGQVNHFTVFAVIASRAPSNFTLSNLDVTRSVEKFWGGMTFAIRTGRNATVTVDLSNNGGLSGTYNGRILLDGKALSNKDITLGSGQSGQLTFEIRNIQPGQHTVQIGNLSQPLPGQELWINRWLIAGCIIVLGTIGWLLYWYFIRRHDETDDPA